MNTSPDNSLNNFFFKYLNNLLLLLSYKINVLNMLNMIDFFSNLYAIGKDFTFIPNLIFGLGTVTKSATVEQLKQ